MYDKPDIIRRDRTDPALRINQCSLKTQPALNSNIHSKENRKTLRFPNITNEPNFLFNANNLTFWLLAFPPDILAFFLLILVKKCRASLQTRPESVESEDSTDTVTLLTCHTERSRSMTRYEIATSFVMLTPRNDWQ